MKYLSMTELESIRSQVVANALPKDGSIMYMGSEGNKHYFKGEASRRTFIIVAEL